MRQPEAQRVVRGEGLTAERHALGHADAAEAALDLGRAQLARIDPDVIVGHNITGFDLDVLLHRLQFHRTPNWSRIGRLRRTAMPRVGQGVGGRDQFTGQLTPGRLVCDTYLAARELVRERAQDAGHGRDADAGAEEDDDVVVGEFLWWLVVGWRW